MHQNYQNLFIFYQNFETIGEENNHILKKDIYIDIPPTVEQLNFKWLFTHSPSIKKIFIVKRQTKQNTEQKQQQKKENEKWMETSCLLEEKFRVWIPIVFNIYHIRAHVHAHTHICNAQIGEPIWVTTTMTTTMISVPNGRKLGACVSAVQVSGLATYQFIYFYQLPLSISIFFLFFACCCKFFPSIHFVCPLSREIIVFFPSSSSSNVLM